MFTLKFGEDLFVDFSQNVGQNIQPAACAMPMTTSLTPSFGRLVNDGLQCWDRILSAFEGEALLPQEFSVKEILEDNRFIELSQNAFLFLDAGIIGVIFFLAFLDKPRSGFRRPSDLNILMGHEKS